MQTKPPKLTIKQAKFCEEYVGNGVAVHAYFAAFGRNTKKGIKRSYDAANQQCQRLLAMPHVQRELEAIRQGSRSRCEVTIDDLNRADTQAGFCDIAKFMTMVDGQAVMLLPAELPPDVRSCVKRFRARTRVVREKEGDARREWVEDVTYELVDAIRARENLARRLGLDKPQTPLEQLLAALSPDLRAKVWAELQPLLHARN